MTGPDIDAAREAANMTTDYSHLSEDAWALLNALADTIRCPKCGRDVGVSCRHGGGGFHHARMDAAWAAAEDWR